MGTQNIIDALAGLSPETDKGTLIKAVDTAVDGILGELDTSGAQKPAPDLLKATEVTLHFLEACQEMKDPDFTRHTRERATELLEAYGKIQDGGGAKAKPKKRRRKAKPKDAAGAGAKKRPRKKKKAKPKADLLYEPTPFTEAFTAALCKFLRQRAMLWYVPQHNLTPTPFPLSSTFGDNLVTALENHFMHRFFNNRRILVMDDDFKGSDYAESAFFEAFIQPKKRNPIRTVWDDGLRTVHRLLTEGETEKKVETKTKTKKKGGLFGFFAKEEKTVDRKVEIDDSDLKAAQAFWDAIAGSHVKYDPPQIEDFIFLHGLFEFDPETIENDQNGTQQLLRQEFGSSQTREGAARDHLNELISSSAEYAGELTALWAYLMNPKEFGYDVFKSFTSSHGTTPEQRKNSLPVFLRWVKDFSELDKPRGF